MGNEATEFSAALVTSPITVLSKQTKLRQHLMTVLHSQNQFHELDLLMRVFDISFEKLLQEFLLYNMDVCIDRGNDVYESIANRLVLHIHNHIENSWHIERQEVVCNYIQAAVPKTIIDIGFGVPSKYMKDIFLNGNEQLTLYDAYPAAFTFSSVLLRLWCKDYRKSISFKLGDMNDCRFVGDYDLYIMQDSIEHCYNPARFLDTQVRYSSLKSKFLLSLPIGPIFPRHYVAWGTDEEAISWLLDHGLTPVKTRPVFVNPEVDLFTEQLGEHFHSLYVLCQKQFN